MDSSRLFISHLRSSARSLAFVPAEAVSLPKPGRKKPSAGSWGQPQGDVGSENLSLNSGGTTLGIQNPSRAFASVICFFPLFLPLREPEWAPGQFGKGHWVADQGLAVCSELDCQE